MKKILIIIGTRPEALKLGPVVRALEEIEGIEPVVCATGQHREMLAPALAAAGIVPRLDLRVMVPGQTPSQVAAMVSEGLAPVLTTERPDWLVVQGDTTTALAGALTAFHHRVPVAHVEAGLRSGRLDAPWPEEANRRLIAVLATLHFAPTPRARDNLLAEGVDPEAVRVTGNTVVDALQEALRRLDEPGLRARLDAELPWVDPRRRLILVTEHRRENLPQGLENLCGALRRLAARGDVQIAYPVHLNPAVRELVRSTCEDIPHLHLLEPLDYPRFIRLLERCHLVITDSGGIQEEAPTLGKPVLLTRAVTERPEALEAGVARLVGTHSGELVEAASELLDSDEAYRAMTGRPNPFGDGRAGSRIAAALAEALGVRATLPA